MKKALPAAAELPRFAHKLSALPQGGWEEWKLRPLAVAHLRLQVILQPDRLHQVELRFDEVDMFFLILQNALEDFAADVVARWTGRVKRRSWRPSVGGS